MRMIRFFLLLCVLFGVSFATPTVFAQSSDEQYQQKLKEIEELKSKIISLQSEAKTLSSALSLITSKKALTQKQVEATQFEIALLTKDLESLNGKIEVLEDTLNVLVTTLLSEAKSTYTQPKVEPISVLFSSKSFSDIHTRYKYLELARAHHQNLLKKTTEAKLSYDDQKIAKEKKQKTVEALRKKLVDQQKELAVQEQSQKKLLSDTKSSEANYQKLLAQAQSELDSFRSFSKSRGANVLPPQNSPDGWFFSQRDERWAGVCIGNSCGTRNEGRILEVGCLVSSTAMVKKKFGEDVNPISIARNSSYFFSNTAYMLHPWPAPGGYRYERSGYNQDKLDAELREGRPVIAHMRIGTADGHFIVIKSGEKGSYTIHDPIEGFDKKFSDFYRISQINNINVLKKT